MTDRGCPARSERRLPKLRVLVRPVGAGCSLTIYPPAPGDEVDATAHLSIDGRELPFRRKT